MNDHDAMTAINAAMDEWMAGKISEFQLINKVARISGQNKFQHDEAAK